MIKIFYKRDYLSALREIEDMEKDMERKDELHKKELEDLKYKKLLEDNENYDPDKDPVVLNAVIEQLKSEHEIERESLTIQINELKEELKTLKKENKQLIKEKANAFVEKTEKKTKTTRKKKEEKENK